MRRQARALVLVFLSIVTAMAMGIASAFMGAVALGATALIVPGTGTPDANGVDHYLENAWDRYIDGIACTVDCGDPDLVGINYPASFWPVSFIPGWCVPGRCDKWDVSVGEGTEHLIDALTPFLDEESDEDVYIFGYSQGGAVVANTLAYLQDLDLSEGVKDRLKVVTIGGIENPDGGLWQRLAWLRYLLGEPVPILDLSFEPGMPVDNGITSTTIGFEYDPVVYAPRYWGNLFAVVNMLAALDTVHGTYLLPNGNNETGTLPYGYTPGPLGTLAPQLNCDLNPDNCREDSYGNTYIMVPATSLPLTDLVRTLADSIGIGGLAKPFIDLVEPVLKVVVDLGFDWSGDPGVVRGSTILPFKIFQNWLKVGVDLAVATVKGVEAFIKNFVPGSQATQLKMSEMQDLVAAPEATEVTPPAEDQPADTGGASGDDGAVVDDEVAGEAVAPEGDVVVTEDEDATDEDTVTDDEVTQEDEDDVTAEDEDVVTDDDVTAEDDATDETAADDTPTGGQPADDDNGDSDTQAAA